MNRLRGGIAALAVILALLAGFVWLTAPMWQGIVYGLVVTGAPAFAILGVGAVLVGVAWSIDPVRQGQTGAPFGRQTRPSFAGGCLPVLVGAATLAVAFVYASLAGPITSKNLYEEAEKRRVGELPDSETVRYLPWQVASTVGRDRSTDPRAELGEFEPIQTEEGISWVAPREPTSRLARRFYGGAPGVLIVNPDNTIEVNDRVFRYGEGLGLNRNWEWQAHRVNYFSEKTNPYYVLDGQEPLLVSPYLKHDLEWAGIVPYLKPYWAGVILVHPSGEIEDLTAREALGDPRFEGERLYPKALARRVMDSFAYAEGYRNTLIGPHANEPVIEDVTGQNPFPFLQPSEGGPQWVAGAEPYGGTDALFMLFNMDARDGSIEYTRFGDEDAMIGPQKALERFDTVFPQYGDTVRPLEPRPVVVEGTIYWMMSVTNRQNSAVTQTLMIEAGGQNETFVLEGLEEVERFVAGDTSVGESAAAGAVIGGGTTATPSEGSGITLPAGAEGDVTGECRQQDGQTVCEITIGE
jgi:hypothetical protein